MSMKSPIGKKKSEISPSGNWIPVSRVTGGDTHHYTNEEHESATLQSHDMAASKQAGMEVSK